MLLLSAALTRSQGALGVNTALFSFCFVVFNFLATATTPLIAAAVSAGDRQQVPSVYLRRLHVFVVSRHA